MAYKLTDKDRKKAIDDRLHNEKIYRESSALYAGFHGVSVEDKVIVLKRLIDQFRELNKVCNTCGAVHALEKRKVQESDITDHSH